MTSKSRYEAIEKLFLAFNREPTKNRTLVDNYMESLRSIDIDILIQAIDHLIMNTDRFPRWIEIQSYCNNQRMSIKKESVDCDICGSIGVIYGMFFDGIEIYSDGFIPDRNGYFYSAIKGCCECDNGDFYRKSMPRANLSELIKSEYNTGKYLSTAQACSEIALRKNMEFNELVESNPKT